MGQFSCVIQEDSPASRAVDELERRLAELHERHYPGDPATCSFTEMARGFMFTEGKQSSSSVVACVMPWETTLADRERYMREVCDIWTEVTGCTDHEVVVAISPIDPT